MSDLILMYEYLTELIWDTLDARTEVDVALHWEAVILKGYYLRKIREMSENI